VNRFGAGRPRRRQDQILAQVAFSRRRRTEVHGKIGFGDVAGMAICIRIDSDRRNAERPERPDDPAGNRSAVGNENACEHQSIASQMSTRTGVGL
jgi:hypothetical protein